MTAIGFNICCSVPNFIEIGYFFTEIWRFDDFQNGDCPPSWILKICILWSRSPYQHAVLLAHTKFCWKRTIGWWVMTRKAIFKMAAATILNCKNFNFSVFIRFNIWCNVPSFIKIGRFFTEIWRFNHFQNFAEIGQSIDELWPKKRFSRWRPPPSSNYKNFNFWSRGCHRVQYLMQYTKFHPNWTIFHWDMPI